jgi:hypothetical protein
VETHVVRGDRESVGLAHVATVSFLASRAAASIGFWVALAGGVALARVSERRGARVGYGASVAAMLQTVAIIGPARFSVPLTQGLSAPMLGALERRATPVPWQMLACGTIRLAHVAFQTAFAIFVLTGGLGVYTDTYNSLTGWLGVLPQGRTAALVLTGVSILVWTVFATVVQVLVYRRGLERWPAGAPDSALRKPDSADEVTGRFDPRAVALAAAIAFTLLLAGTSWPLLGAIAAWLAIAWAASGGDRSVVNTGVFLALLLGAGVFAFTLIGGIGLDAALRRGIRALLFVLVATWLRYAAGASGLREVSRRTLGVLRRVPSAREASAVLDELGSGKQLGPAVRSVFAALRSTPARPLPVTDAVLGWVAAESLRFRPVEPAPASVLHARVRDVALVALAAAPVASLVLV